MVDYRGNALYDTFVQPVQAFFADRHCSMTILTSAYSNQIEDLRSSITKSLRALDLDLPFTPIIKHPRSRTTGAKVIDALQFVPISLTEGPYRECIYCGRVTKVAAQKGAVVWGDRWVRVCPICNGKWLWMKNQLSN